MTDQELQKLLDILKYVPEDRIHVGLNMDATLEDNSILGYENDKEFRKGPFLDEDKIRKRSLQMIKDYQIHGASVDGLVSKLSGGNMQKVVLAREFAHNPDLLIVDQPVRGLDVGSIEFVHKAIIKERDRGAAVLLVSVELDEILSLSDRVGVMYLGNFVEVGDKKELYKNPCHPYTQALLSAVPIPDPTAKRERIILKGSIPSALNPPTGCKFHTRCPKCMEICKKKAPERTILSPEHEVYCHLYSKEKA